MTKTQRTLYFAGVCVALFATACTLLALTAGVAHADTIPWTNPNGVGITSGFAIIPGQPPLTDAGASVCVVQDYPYDPTWGAYPPTTYTPGSSACVAAGGDPTLAGVNTAFIYANRDSTGRGGNGLGTATYEFALSGFGANGGGTHSFALFFIGPGGVMTPDNSLVRGLGTSITITNPTQGTSTPSTTFNIDANYTIGSDLSQFSLNGSLPNKIGINFTLFKNDGSNQQINLGTDFSIASSSGSYTYSTTTTQSQADYTLVGTLVGVYGTFIPPPPDCTPLPPFQTCTGTTESQATLATSNISSFSVDNGTFPLLGFTVGSTTSRNGLATTTCSIVAIGGCFQNALAFLFYPSPGVLDQFRLLWGLIQNKPPFGYVSQTLNGLRSLNASSTPAFSFGNIPLVDVIFTPFRTGLAGILWLGFFIAWYRGRLRHLDI